MFLTLVSTFGNLLDSFSICVHTSLFGNCTYFVSAETIFTLIEFCFQKFLHTLIVMIWGYIYINNNMHTHWASAANFLERNRFPSQIVSLMKLHVMTWKQLYSVECDMIHWFRDMHIPGGNKFWNETDDHHDLFTSEWF